MQSQQPQYLNEDVSARSVTSSRTAGESQSSYQRAGQPHPRHSLANVSPSKIQSVRRQSEVAPNSGRSVTSSNSGQGWGPAALTGASPVPRQPTPGTAASYGGPGAIAAIAMSHDEDYMLGLMAEPQETYPASASPPAMLMMGSAAPLSMSEAGAGEGLGTRTQFSVPAPSGSGLSPQGDDLVHEVLAINTLAMQRCREEQLDDATNLLNEAYLKLEANGNGNGGDASGHRPSSGGSTGNRGGGSAGLPSNNAHLYGSGGDEEFIANGPAIADQQLLDELRSITLNNMGVVECHRGQPRQALSHFEAARQLEETWNMGSPSVALNTCAAYNALQMYDKATAAALETIDMLRALAVQRKRQRLLQRRQIEAEQLSSRQSRQLTSTAGTRGAGGAASSRSRSRQARKREEEEEALLLQGASELVIADSENDALWGAAWHNLAVAQINTAAEARRRAGTANTTRHPDPSEITNTLVIFQNAMRATQDLLGPKHAMTRAVVETYREARKALRAGGAFKQHRVQMTSPLPPVDPRDRVAMEMSTQPAPGKTQHGTLQQQKKDLTITFRGEATGGEKLTERMDAAAYPGAKPESYRARKHYTSSSNFKGASQRTMSNMPASKKASSTARKNKAWTRGPLQSMPLSDTLMHASELYGNPHPLLYTSTREEENGAGGAAVAPASTWSEGMHGSKATASGGGPAMTAVSKDVLLTSARATRPRPPLPENLSNEAYYAHYLALLDERERLARSRENVAAGATASSGSGALPMIRGASGRDGTAATDGTGTGAANAYPSRPQDDRRSSPPIIMHHPPATRASTNTATASADRTRSTTLQDESSLGTQPTGDVFSRDATTAPAAHVTPEDNARYLLLAQPPAPASLSNAASPAGSVRTPRTVGADVDVENISTSPVPAQVPISSATQTEVSSSHGAPTRELFDAMWVTTDETMLLPQGKRAFGRPAYYVPTTTLLQNYQQQEAAEAVAQRRASGQRTAGPDTRTSVMYYTPQEEEEDERDDANDTSDGRTGDSRSESKEEGTDEPAPRARANTAQHEENATAEENHRDVVVEYEEEYEEEEYEEDDVEQEEEGDVGDGENDETSHNEDDDVDDVHAHAQTTAFATMDASTEL